ncbi:MFS transporter [Anoxybacillus rupiensis]|uniref:MFS transporter n=1 Tax=Anoxybacteroides rupiense TaxID=311460 RepID=A0ABD5ITM5_9BACL|nr:MFS transporter [Anoxybacillus rupiensis]
MPRELWMLLIGMVFYVTGASFLWPLNAIYVHEELHKSLAVAGVVLMLNSAATIVGNLLGGILFDKWGGFRSLMLGAVTTLVAIVFLIFFHGWPAYPILLAVIGLGSGIVFPVVNAYAGAIWPEGGRRAFNAVYVAINIGVAAGSSFGGWIASYSFEWIFITNTLMYLLFLVVVLFGLKAVQWKSGQKPSIKNAASVSIHSRTAWRAFLILCTGYFLCWLSYVQWSTTVAAYTQQLGLSLRQYSLLWTINGVLIVLAQPLLGKLLSRWSNQLKPQMIVGFFIFALSFLILWKASAFWHFVAAMVVLTIAEIMVWPAIPTVASQLASQEKEGFYQGIVNSTATAGRMIGPVLGGLVVDHAGMKPLLAILFVFVLIAILTTAIYDRKLKQESPIETKAAV